jgi:hypothetical protein
MTLFSGFSVLPPQDRTQNITAKAVQGAGLMVLARIG